jgi:DNA-binding response OmpR family regulator
MNASEQLQMFDTILDAYAWSAALDKSLGVRMIQLHPHQLSTQNLNALYSLILIDATLPHASTETSSLLERCRQLRTDYGNPILLLIDRRSEHSLVEFYSTGIDECIVKPIRAEHLAAKVNAWLRWSFFPTPQMGEPAGEGQLMVGYLHIPTLASFPDLDGTTNPDERSVMSRITHLN